MLFCYTRTIKDGSRDRVMNVTRFISRHHRYIVSSHTEMRIEKSDKKVIEQIFHGLATDYLHIDTYSLWSFSL